MPGVQWLKLLCRHISDAVSICGVIKDGGIAVRLSCIEAL